MISMRYSGTYLSMVDYRENVGNGKVINDLFKTGDLTVTEFIESIRIEYDTSHISSIPSCTCGNLRKPKHRGKVCDICGTVCCTVTSHPIMSHLYIRPPTGVKKLIRTSQYTLLRQFFTSKRKDIISFICNKNFKIDSPAIENAIANAGIPRGLNNFYDHFEEILIKLTELKLHKNCTKAERLRKVKRFISDKEKIFCDFLPLPSKIAFVTEITPIGKYVDGTIAPALDSICSLLNIDEDLTHQQVKENRTAKAIDQLSQFYYTYIKTHINPKEGIGRQHIYGTMTDFTGYCVISSDTRNVNPFTCKPPWSYSVGLLKMHIRSFMLNRMNVPARKIDERVLAAISKYDEGIHEIMNTLIKESPYEWGLPCSVLRNPSLDKLSIQRLFISEIKTEITDRTLSIPITNTKGWNADFDGDHQALKLHIDQTEADYFGALCPGKSVWDLQQLRKIRGVNSFHSPFLTTLSNFLYLHERREHAN